MHTTSLICTNYIKSLDTLQSSQSAERLYGYHYIFTFYIPEKDDKLLRHVVAFGMT